MQSSHSSFLSNFTDKHTINHQVFIIQGAFNVQTWLMHGRDDSVPL